MSNTKVEKSSIKGFQAGHIKTGGRSKGTPNKNKQELINRIESEFPGYDPVLSMVAIARDENTPLELRITCHKEVAKYTHPQRKAVEMTADVDMPIISIKGL